MFSIEILPCGASWQFPPDKCISTMTLSFADTTWSLVFHPPFDFPIHCCPCFLKRHVRQGAIYKRYCPKPALLLWPQYFFLLQRIKNTLYYAIFTPSFKSLVNAIPFAVFLWKCPPLAPIFGNIQDSVDKCVIVDFYIPTLNRKTLFDSCVLRFCDIHVFIISYFDLSVNML